MSKQISVIIPNWNGAAFIVRCLSAVVQSAQDSGFSWEAIVVDDASADGSPDTIEKQFPSVRLLQNSVNLGFGATCNRGAAEACGQIAIFLNNDLVPRPDMIKELAAPLLADPTLFGVSAKTVDWNGGEPNHVNMCGHLHNGKFRLAWSDDSEAKPTMFLQGGSCAVRRDEFLRLGGFCHLFAPGYWEDYDISYLALKAGWKNVYAPLASAYHFGQGSMNKAYGDEQIRFIKRRNTLRFLALNLTDDRLLKQWLYVLPEEIAFGQGERLKIRAVAFASLCKALPEIRRERERRLPLIKVSDEAIFAQFTASGTPC